MNLTNLKVAQRRLMTTVSMDDQSIANMQRALGKIGISIESRSGAFAVVALKSLFPSQNPEIQTTLALSLLTRIFALRKAEQNIEEGIRSELSQWVRNPEYMYTCGYASEYIRLANVYFAVRQQERALPSITGNILNKLHR